MYQFRDRFPQPDDNMSPEQTIRNDVEGAALERVSDLLTKARADFKAIMGDTMDTLPRDTPTRTEGQLEDCLMYLNEAADSVGALKAEDVGPAR
ncbi:MAG: hypothetical protein V7727_02120 [Sneathiella sp.]